MKKEVPHDKYFLRSLHQEIDLYDRKLAYLENHIHFASMARREGAEGKLLAKRASLATTECPTCEGTLFLAEVDHTRKVETWDGAEIGCDHTEDVPSPSGR